MILKRGIFLILSFFILTSILISSVTYAANEIAIEINGNPVDFDTDPLIKNGTTYVPMRILEKIKGLEIKTWDNTNKTLIVSDSETDAEITLQVNNKTAKKGTTTLAIEQPPIIINNRVMVPIRFIAEAFNSDVIWNSYSKTAYIARTTKEQKEQLNSSNLTEARLAALHLPVTDSLPDINYSGDSLGDMSIYFVEGEDDNYFYISNGVISYYQITENAARVTWRAVIGDKKTTDTPFYVTGILKQVGTQPDIKSSLIYYYIMTHVGLAQYGRINTDGTTEQFGEKDLPNLDALFPIEEES